MIDTSGAEESKNSELDEIDEMLGDGYTKAVTDRARQGANPSRLQAEPSHFHLKTLAEERSKRPLKKLTQSAPAEDGADSKEENWVVTDKISMVNFKQIVQDPAIEYPFELDDFQKRAVYRLE